MGGSVQNGSNKVFRQSSYYILYSTSIRMAIRASHADDCRSALLGSATSIQPFIAPALSSGETTTMSALPQKREMPYGLFFTLGR